MGRPTGDRRGAASTSTATATSRTGRPADAAPIDGSQPPAGAGYALARQGWLSSVLQAGSGALARPPGRVPRTSREGCSRSWRIVFWAAVGRTRKFQPPVWLGVSTIMRMAERARKTLRPRVSDHAVDRRLGAM